MVLKKEKESRVKHWSAFEQLRPVTHGSKTKLYHLHARRALANVSSDYKHLTRNHTISFENIIVMIHSSNRGFAVRTPYVQNMP